VLATFHASRGIDAVPVCFVAAGTRVAVPIDRVKEKSTTDLQRERNLDHDPRATLLCEHWDPDDWSQLWWVRATLGRVVAQPNEVSVLEEGLRSKYVQYAGSSFAGLLVFEITEVTGWVA
jgi:hypothetical protein